jgi:hypothetical protein
MVNLVKVENYGFKYDTVPVTVSVTWIDTTYVELTKIYITMRVGRIPEKCHRFGACGSMAERY